MSRLSVVFGGSRGIGRAVSGLLAQRGHRVVVISRNQEAAQATAAALPGGKQTNTPQTCLLCLDHLNYTTLDSSTLKVWYVQSIAHYLQYMS